MNCVRCGDEVTLWSFIPFGRKVRQYMLRTRNDGAVCPEGPGFQYHEVRLATPEDVEEFLQDVPTIVDRST